jgi:nucleoside-diphosphate kinase
MTERTLILVKPDGVARGLVGEILRRVEARGYPLVALDLHRADRELLERHYAEHVGQPFFEPLLEYMLSGPIVAAVAEGERVVEAVRALAGATDPIAALPGTIRGDLARKWDVPVHRNLIHGSDSVESAEREIALWFPGLSR